MTDPKEIAKATAMRLPELRPKTRYYLFKGSVCIAEPVENNPSVLFLSNKKDNSYIGFVSMGVRRFYVNGLKDAFSYKATELIPCDEFGKVAEKASKGDYRQLRFMRKKRAEEKEQRNS